MKYFLTTIMLIAIASLVLCLHGCNRNLIKTAIITPSLSEQSVPQGATIIVTFKSNTPLVQDTTVSVDSSTLIDFVKNGAKSCLIPTGGNTCSVTFQIDSSENPVTHQLNYKLNETDHAALSQPSQTFTVRGVLALSVTDTQDLVNQGQSAEDLTVTNINEHDSIIIDQIDVTDTEPTSLPLNQVASADGFDVYNGSTSGPGAPFENWCRHNTCDDYCYQGQSLAPNGGKCRIYIRTTKQNQTSFGVAKQAFLNVYGKVAGNNEAKSTSIVVKNTPIYLFSVSNGNISDISVLYTSNTVTLLANANGRIYTIISDALGNVYFGGDFSSSTYVPVANNIVKWDGPLSNKFWSGLGSGIGGPVYALTIDQQGKIYAGGNFTTAGGNAANNIAVWDASQTTPSWSPLGSGITGGSNAVFALAVDSSNKIYAGGNFTTAGGNAANNIAVWDAGQTIPSWSPLSSGITGGSNTVSVLAVDSSNKLYAGGNFTTAGGNAANNIAVWDAGQTTPSWSPLSSGITGGNNIVKTLAVDSSNNLYAGGDFLTAGGITVNNIAKWSGGQINPSWSQLNGGLDGVVSSIMLDPQDMIYAWGDFSSLVNPASNSILTIWNSTQWTKTSISGPPPDTSTVLYRYQDSL